MDLLSGAKLGRHVCRTRFPVHRGSQKACQRGPSGQVFLWQTALGFSLLKRGKQRSEITLCKLSFRVFVSLFYQGRFIFIYAHDTLCSICYVQKFDFIVSKYCVSCKSVWFFFNSSQDLRCPLFIIAKVVVAIQLHVLENYTYWELD